MSLNLRESFHVRAPTQRVWGFLIDPAQVVQCLPGAELTETVDERTYRGRVKVKVGPISTAYDGTARLTEVNERARTMRMVGEGREMGAAGSARMTMVGTVVPDADGGSVVEVDATIDIAGRVMQFGRGLVESVSRQLFKEFAEAVRQRLEQEEAGVTVATAKTPEVLLPNVSAPALSATPVAVSTPRELRVIPLLSRAIVDWIRRLFGGK